MADLSRLPGPLLLSPVLDDCRVGAKRRPATGISKPPINIHLRIFEERDCRHLGRNLVDLTQDWWISTTASTLTFESLCSIFRVRGIGHSQLREAIAQGVAGKAEEIGRASCRERV